MSRTFNDGQLGILIRPDNILWPFFTLSDCARCVLNAANIGYLASCDDVTKYYQCQEGVDGGYQLSLMSCPRCTIWDQAQLTCVRNTILDQCPESGDSEVEEHVTNFGCE